MRIHSFYNKLYIFIGVPWLFLVVFLQKMLTEVKIGLLLLLMIVSFCDLLSERIKIIKGQFIFIYCFIVYCIISLALGVVLGFDFDFKVDFSLIQNYFITPLCILLIATVLGYSEDRKRALWKILIWFSFLLGLLDISRMITHLMGGSPWFLSFIEVSSENFLSSKLAFRVRNEASFFFLLPISIYTVFNWKSKLDRNISILASLLGILYAVVSGRKMLELEILFMIPFAICYRRSINSIIQKNGALILGSIFAILLLLPVLLTQMEEILGVKDVSQVISDTLTNGLSSDAKGVISRTSNFEALINLWTRSPIFGNGLNSYAIESLANPKTKWSYEIFYIAWLAQTGLIGLGLLVYGIIYICKRLVQQGLLLNDRRYFAILLGFFCFILAGASNPLLYFIWPWAISLAFCNKSQIQI